MSVGEGYTMKQTYKLVPPDGGYGYVILFAVAINFVSTTMFFVCFGMIFNDFFIQTGMGSTSVSLLTGTIAISNALSGFLSGPLLKTMSRRKLALIGSTFFNVGLFGTVFVKSQAQLLVCQGFVQYFGFGFLYNVSCTALTDYFVEKRLFAMSIAKTLAAAAAIVGPIVVSWAKNEYGFRGTLIIMSGAGLQTFVASALMQPVAWHMRKKLVGEVQEKKLLLEKDEMAQFKDKVMETRVINLSEIETPKSEYEEKERTKTSIGISVITWIKNFVDWPLFKRFLPTCGCLGPPIAAFADVTYVYFLAQSLYDLKWDNDQVKWALAIIGFGDITGRILLIFSSSWLNRLGSHPIYILGLLISITTKLCMLWVRDYSVTLAVIAFMGLSRCILTVLYALVVSDSVQPEEFASAMGITMLLFGILSMALGPIAGAIRDATGDYMIMSLALVACLVAVTVAWSIELLRARRKTKTTTEIK